MGTWPLVQSSAVLSSSYLNFLKSPITAHIPFQRSSHHTSARNAPGQDRNIVERNHDDYDRKSASLALLDYCEDSLMHVKDICGRHFPRANLLRSSKFFVELDVDGEKQRTQVCEATTSPLWSGNYSWFVTVSCVRLHPVNGLTYISRSSACPQLKLRLFIHHRIGKPDMIGEAEIDITSSETQRSVTIGMYLCIPHWMGDCIEKCSADDMVI